MTTRRNFIQIGLTAAAAVPALARAGSAPMPAGSVSGSVPTFLASVNVPLHAAVVDARFAQAEPFTAEMRQRGVEVLSFRAGDVTRVWFDRLDRWWRTEAVAIAGLTAHGPLFVLETCAADHGMRVLHREQRAQAVAMTTTGGTSQPALYEWVLAPKSWNGRV